MRTLKTSMKARVATLMAWMRWGLLLFVMGAEGVAEEKESAEWWNSEWTVRKKIAIDAGPKGAAITDAIGSVPLLMRLHDGNFQFALAREDGSDLRFVVAEGKKEIPFHLEKLDALMGEAFVWVRLPEMKAGETATVWMYYGNAKAGKAEDAKGTYDVETVGAYHFAHRNALAQDSSMAGNNAEGTGVGADGAMIGGGLRLSGKDSLKIPGGGAFEWTLGGAATVSAWIKPSVANGTMVLFSRKEEGRAFRIGLDQGVLYAEISEGSNTVRTSGGAPLAANAWVHVAVVIGNGSVTVYLGGERYGAAAGNLPAMKSVGHVGGDVAGGETGFTGDIDELVLSKVARPAGYLQLLAMSQGPDKVAKLVTAGADEQASTWMSGTFGILMSSLTVDGWIVIAILVVMAVISWWVMWGKASYLSGLEKGNGTFMDAWRHLARDLTVLDDADVTRVNNLGGHVDAKGLRQMRQSSVFRIYHVGVEEMRHRLAADRELGTRKALSGRSIQAIRASLDGIMVRETQKLNSLMVLLTIAISGGPFLGLLGTVVGVMITFASIAAAGDVNVNAIAPGIAAALVATVAGLFVAIPAMFGYNYLTSKIKEATTDMHVFVDEFITKVAEFYRE